MRAIAVAKNLKKKQYEKVTKRKEKNTDTERQWEQKERMTRLLMPWIIRC